MDSTIDALRSALSDRYRIERELGAGGMATVYLGRSETAITERLNVHAPRFSPDGKRLALDIGTADGRDVWTLALDRRTLTRATFDRDGHDATWSPDGRSLTYISLKTGTLDLRRARPGSTEPAESLFASPKLTFTGTWLRDGSALITDANDLRDESNGDRRASRHAACRTCGALPSERELGPAAWRPRISLMTSSTTARWRSRSSSPDLESDVWVMDVARDVR